MNESITPTERHFTACASFAALGVHVSYLDLFGPIREGVHIAQKTVKHSPTDKLYDAFISRLSGGHGLVEITTCCNFQRNCEMKWNSNVTPKKINIKITKLVCKLVW